MLIFNYLKRYKKLVLFVLALAAINQIFSLLDPQIIRLIIDNYATKATEMDKTIFIRGIGLLLLTFIGVALVSRIAKNFQDYFTNVITQKIGTEIYSDSVRHSLSLPYNVFEDRRSGELLQKMQKARTDFQTLISGLINMVFVSFIGLMFVIIYAFFVHWSIGVSFILVIPLIGGFIFLISRKIRKAQTDIVKESAELAGSTTETIRNIELVKSLGLEKQEIERLNKVNERILELELKKVKLVRTLSFIQGTLINAVRTLLLFLMLWLLFYKNISVGEFFTLFIYSFFIFGPLGEISNIVTQYQESKASSGQLEEILNTKPEDKKEERKKIDKINSIKFKNLGFDYNSKTDILKDVNIEISNGESVAFVGLSGSGKTTLIKILLGLYQPKKGQLLINNLNMKDVDYDLLRKKIGFVSQETQLFSGTIRENLLFVNPNATERECLDAMKMAAASSILDRAEKGIDTKIGENGIKLSGGEKQRLAIARALLRNPELIIFDEATSNLDSLTEKEITKTIKEISKIKSELITIIVAHRLSTVMHTDKIYVLEKGEVIEKGNHSELLKKKGLYFALWREQMGKAN